MAPPHKLVCVAAPYDLRLNRSKAVLLPKVNLHIYPSPVRISTERDSKTNRAEVVHQNCISHYRCHLIYVTIPTLTSASTFATGRGSPYCLRCQQTSARITKAHRPLSLFSVVRDIHSYPQARYFTTRLISLPNSRLQHCRDLIFFRWFVNCR